MTKNEGTVDRLLRGLVVAPVALILALVAGIGSVAGVLLVVVGVVMAVTAVVGSCPIYKLLGFSSDRHTVAPR